MWWSSATATGGLKAWFDAHQESVVFLRPDRCIAGACIAQLAPELSASLFDVLTLTPGGGNPVPLALCCMSHSPLLNLPGPSQDLLDDIDGALAQAREFVADFDPELVVIFAPDHYNGFFYKLMPPFCIGTDAQGVGDYGTHNGPLDVPEAIAVACAKAVLVRRRRHRHLGEHGRRSRHRSAAGEAVRRRHGAPGDTDLHQLGRHAAGAVASLPDARHRGRQLSGHPGQAGAGGGIRWAVA